MQARADVVQICDDAVPDDLPLHIARGSETGEERSPMFPLYRKPSARWVSAGLHLAAGLGVLTLLAAIVAE